MSDFVAPTNAELFDGLIDLKNAVDHHFSTIERTFAEGLELIARRFEQEHQWTVRRFDAHDRRFDDHDRRFDEHDRRFDEHDRRFDRLDERVDALTALVQRIDAKLN
jgi:hypothetical protein